jgi:hypothetical protein
VTPVAVAGKHGRTREVAACRPARRWMGRRAASLRTRSTRQPKTALAVGEGQPGFRFFFSIRAEPPSPSAR